MSTANPALGCAPDPRRTAQAQHRGHQAKVAKYMVRRRETPSQSWRTSLRHHVEGIDAIDVFVLASASFR